MQIKKRNGTLEEFDINKIINAVDKAFKSQGRNIPWYWIRDIKEDKILPQLTSVEDIQDHVEFMLMQDTTNWGVAKAFILYREQHKKIRNNAQKNIDFIKKFIASNNTANATIDDNSNVSNHNIAVLNNEIHKEDNKDTNLKIWENKLKELYPDFDYKQMMIDFRSIMYPHDISSQIGEPYCVAITLYPFLLNGLKELGGLSAKPENIDSFCGMFVNLIFTIASQYKGAVAIPGLFLCMDYFLRKEWGDNYYLKKDMIISSETCLRKQTIHKQIHQYFQQICYTLMQPSGARGAQAVFWNCSIFDKPFYDTMYENFYFPDNTKPKWESFNWLQKDFMHWLNQERLKCILTFPVLSVALIYQNDKFVDEELADFAAQEYSEGNSFFTYISDSADSLSSCCRLSSKISKPQFNFTNGQLSEMTGSKNVITLNLNRIIQDISRAYGMHGGWKENTSFIYDELVVILDRVYKYQTAYNEILKELYKANMLTVYNAGFIDMKKQYLTIGINGLNQAAEFLGMQCSNNKDYQDFCNLVFKTIKEQNQLHKTNELMFNTEFTPCESASIKLYNQDKKDGYWVPNDTNLYASYIYKPNDGEISILDKIILHGRDYCGDYLDGGSSAHLNLDSHLSKKQYVDLLKFAAIKGCKYFTFNIPNCECEDCGFIAKQPFDVCPKCGSKNVSLWDRVIGYITKIINWSEGRQKEQKTRIYHKNK